MSGWHTDVNTIRMVKIRKVRVENPKAKTFFLEDHLCALAKPGQFIMFWIPGIDEIPLSLSSVKGTQFSVTVKEVGKATQALNNIEEGHLIGVRGPFGTNFKPTGTKILVVGGGIGIAPLMLLTEILIKEDLEVKVINGAKTRTELLFTDQLYRLHKEGLVNVIFTTDDGSYGIKGLATDVAEKILCTESFHAVYSCGNELMLRKIYDLTVKYAIPLQVSLERIMLCAMGICGSCVIGKYRVCKDGPVFDTKQLKEVEEEFGRFKRSLKGEKIPV